MVLLEKNSDLGENVSTEKILQELLMPPKPVPITDENYLSELSYELGRLESFSSTHSLIFSVGDLTNIAAARMNFFCRFFSFFIGNADGQLKKIGVLESLSSVKVSIQSKIEAFSASIDDVQKGFSIMQVTCLNQVIINLLTISSQLKKPAEMEKTDFEKYVWQLTHFLENVLTYHVDHYLEAKSGEPKTASFS